MARQKNLDANLTAGWIDATSAARIQAHPLHLWAKAAIDSRADTEDNSEAC